MTTFNVPADGTLQAVIDGAARGDTINVALGTYTAPVSGFNLPLKSGSFNGSNYITIQSANVALLSSRRQSPADVTNMPKIQIVTPGITLMTVVGTGWKLDGLELTNDIPSPTTGADTTPAMVEFQVTAADMIVDRCVVHPHEAPSVANNYMTTGRYAFNVGGDRFSVQRSYIYDFFGKDPSDSQIQGVVAATTVTGISNTNPTVITYGGTPAVQTGDRVQVEFAGGGLDGYFRPGSTLSGDFVVTRIDATHFSMPIDLSGTETWNSTNAITLFYRWPRMSSITLGSPTAITMSQPHGMTTGQKIRPEGLSGSLGSAIVGNDYTVTVTGATTFTIPANTTGLSAYSGSGGYYKAEGSGQQTIAFGIGADVQDFTATNNYVQAWYATMQTAGSDSTPTLTTTVLASPTPTASDVYVADTTGISAGMLIAMDTTHFDDPSKCPFGGQGGDRPCFAFGVVGTVNSGTGQIHFSTPLKIKNGFGVLVSPTAAILSPGQVNITGKNPTNINLYYNTLDIPFDFASFHYAANGNTGKGVIEGKDCTDCITEGNIIDGFPSSFSHTSVNQNGSSPWMSTFNVVIRNNWFKAFRSGVLLSFVDYNARNTQGYGATITNNLFNGGVGYTGLAISLNSPARDVVYEHNTCTNGYLIGLTSVFTSISNPGASDPYYPTTSIPGVVYRNNIIDGGTYVATAYDAGNPSSFGTILSAPVLTYNGFAKTYAGSDPTSIFTAPSNKVDNNWAATNFVGSDPSVITDWELQPSSPFYRAGSDGADMGVNIQTLVAALANNDGFASTSAGFVTISGNVALSGGITVG